MKYSLCIVLFALAVSHSEELPVEHFGHLPMVEQPSVSPSGDFVAIIVNSEAGPTVNIAPFGTRDLRAILKLERDSDRIDWIEWANDERLLVAASSSEILMGDRFRVSRLYSIGRDGKGLREIRRKMTAKAPWWAALYDTTRIVSWLPEEPRYVLLELYDEFDEALAVYKVDIYKNKFEKLFNNKYDVSRWYSNGKGEVVLGLERDEDLITLWFRPDPNEDWEVLSTRELFESHTFWPILIEEDTAFVLSDHEIGRQAIWRYDIVRGEFVELMHSVEGFDVDDAILNEERDAIVGMRHFSDYRVDTYFDEEYQSASRLVRDSFKQYETSIVSRSDDGQRLIVSAIRDDSPPKYFWLDLAKKAGGLWYSKYPYLEQKALAAVSPIRFEASDGVELSGYLTLPQLQGDAAAPLVVFPHGGPAARDYRYFDPWVQFFANRGYAVLQVNFRGSAGFGSDFEVAGYREWGLSMQQDIYDAVEWVSSNEKVDTDRSCLVGASYGGYVALTASFQRPTDFDCFVSIAGLSDLVEHARKNSFYDDSEFVIDRTIGDINDAEDRRQLEENSAINHLQKIRRPILLVHGTHDTQVRIKQSRDFAKKARAAGIDVEYVELKNGTHYFDEYGNRLAVFDALDRFLDRHL